MDTEPVVMKKRKKKMDTTSHIEEEEEDNKNEEEEVEEDEEEYYYYSSSSSPHRKRERSNGSKFITPRKGGGGSNNNKRRFSDEQVKSLERIFELETTKLEPRKKVEIAREVGLQPRQVAIWFQNKRARWKSKEMEKNYKSLKTSFDCLKSRYESMKMEKEALLAQMHELRNMVEDNNQQQGGGLHGIDKRSFGEDEEDEKKVEKERINHSDYDYMAAEEDHKGMINGSCEEYTTRETLLEIEGCNKINGEVNSSEDQPQQLLTKVSSSSSHEHMEMMSSFVPPTRWCSFDSGCLYDMHTSSVNYCSPWWESLS